MGEPVLRTLYPQEVREKDLVTVCAGIARYLRKEGYWPKTKELCEYLASDRGGTVDCVKQLSDAGMLVRTASKHGFARYALTERGWNLIGVKPMEPWRKPPTNALIRRAVNEAARRMIALESGGFD